MSHNLRWSTEARHNFVLSFEKMVMLATFSHIHRRGELYSARNQSYIVKLLLFNSTSETLFVAQSLRFCFPLTLKNFDRSPRTMVREKELPTSITSANKARATNASNRRIKSHVPESTYWFTLQ